MKNIGRIGLVLALVLLGSQMTLLKAERFELYPYVGGLLTPRTIAPDSNPFTLRQQAMYGVKGEFFVSRHLEVGGNFAYVDHVDAEESISGKRGYLWEGTANYRFDLEKVKPFLAVSVGGLTVTGDRFTIATTPLPIQVSSDTFLTFSYGGGVKVPKLFGPVGLRGEMRARTVPNLLFGQSTTWLEPTGGIIISF